MLILSAINPEQALSDDEAELMELDLAAVAAGSTEALERLYNTAKAAVYSYSLSVLRNVQDAEDVLHDCFVNIFTAAAGYRPHGKPMAWIITIAKNLCFARLRQHNRQEQLPDEDWSEMLADNAGLSNEDRLVLRECLGRLSEEENRIVVLHAVAGFKHREIASVTGMPLATVLSKYRRAIAKLRENLQEQRRETTMKHNEQEIKAMVKKAYSAATPDVLESVLSDCKKLKGRVTPMKKKNYLKSIIAAAAAVVFVLAGVIGFGTYQKANKVVSTVALDVNPGIEITVNAKEKVLDVKAMNDDAKKVIGDMNFKGSDLDVAVNALIGSMLRCGYLSEITNSILVSVDSSDAAQGEALQKRIAAEIEAILNQNGGGSVLSQTVSHDAELEKLAAEYGITLGKAKLIQQITSASPLYTFESLVSLSINDLNLLMNSGKLNLGGIDRSGTPASGAYIGEEAAKRIAFEHAGVAESEITEYECEMDYEHGRMVYDIEFSGSDSTNGGYIEYDYHIDAENGEILKYDFEHDDDHHATPAPGSEYITSEEAIAFALERAGLARNQVTNLKAEFETEHGVALYEVEFDANGYEYEIKVNAADGSILKFDRDYDDDHNHGGHHENPTAAPTAAPTQAPSESYIGEERAKQIAFNRAGVSASQVKNLKVKLDTDDGRAIYEIEFDANGYEYDVDVDAVNGNVVDFDKDAIDDDDDEPKPTPAPAGDYIGAERAKKIAFNRAGISASQAEELEVELEREDGRMVYTVEFKAGGYEYEVEIDALTGEILDYDVERD